jgi:hypothetical protein
MVKHVFTRSQMDYPAGGLMCTSAALLAGLWHAQGNGEFTDASVEKLLHAASTLHRDTCRALKKSERTMLQSHEVLKTHPGFPLTHTECFGTSDRATHEWFTADPGSKNSATRHITEILADAPPGTACVLTNNLHTRAFLVPRNQERATEPSVHLFDPLGASIAYDIPVPEAARSVRGVYSCVLF